MKLHEYQSKRLFAKFGVPIPLGDIGKDKNKPDLTRLDPGAAVGVHCIAQDSKGNLYVDEIYSERAQKFVPITTRVKK